MTEPTRNPFTGYISVSQTPDEDPNKRAYLHQPSLVVPSYPGYDANTADLKITILSDARLASTEKKKKKFRFISLLGGFINHDTNVPGITFLVHTSRFSCFEVIRQKVCTRTSARLQVVNVAQPWPRTIKCLTFDMGSITPLIFDRVVEWVYTNDYSGAYANAEDLNLSDSIGDQDDRLDKKLAAAGIVLGGPELVELAIRKMRDRMQAKSEAAADAENRPLAEARENTKQEEQVKKK
ncbi:hypothetical protein ABW19_dt0208396 [Dactylella cylindrospora]|nr:hypothetical protein ABW19_dt0208396 [Dactylella cylindrospora]